MPESAPRRARSTRRVSLSMPVRLACCAPLIAPAALGRYAQGNAGVRPSTSLGMSRAPASSVAHRPGVLAGGQRCVQTRSADSSRTPATYWLSAVVIVSPEAALAMTSRNEPAPLPFVNVWIFRALVQRPTCPLTSKKTLPPGPLIGDKTRSIVKCYTIIDPFSGFHSTFVKY